MPIDHKPVVLIVLDGWGYSENPENNAIYHAKKPTWDRLWKQHPHALIKGSGADVGLPTGQMGNSEVGHLNLGAGRVVYQEFTRVSRAIRTGSFFKNQTLTDAVDLAKENGKAVHIIGLLSDGGVHSHQEHIQAMVQLAHQRGAKTIYLHAFLDGRDTPPKSATKFLEEMMQCFQETPSARIASIVGRYYAMDRDHRWPRVKAAYDLLTSGTAEYEAKNPLEALEMAYARGETDEFVKPTRIIDTNGKPVCINDGDVVISMNYRSDRARQITRPFIETDFAEFDRVSTPSLGDFISLTEYSSEFDVPVAFPPDRLQNVFGEYIASLGLRQLRIAETEKYAHVTFFFNGGTETASEGEDRILINSPDVATYDLQPEMSAPALTEKLIEAIKSDKYDTIICNYANPDMVGHTGNYEATVKAIEALDACLAKVITALEQVGGEAIITADHGNAEQMRDKQTGQSHTAHTSNPVPLIYVGRPATLVQSGALSDVAPSLLYLMGLDKPPEMGGDSLITLARDGTPKLHPVEDASNDRKIG
ncbi:MAG: 2,3-bisphosphoglycerate-independent phosphoglycerate mutase [Gammaproteobacteria bacterium]|nr:2,3-bisphosphoglycerate-independent phosphoglycerate mutase [Gammaproteobacteria bacterium]MDH5800272.1 2,3-bisphosphoglycerate-independent phosphoglycerate mutase [Gammaproteobacteria bacterium]